MKTFQLFILFFILFLQTGSYSYPRAMSLTVELRERYNVVLRCVKMLMNEERLFDSDSFEGRRDVKLEAVVTKFDY